MSVFCTHDFEAKHLNFWNKESKSLYLSTVRGTLRKDENRPMCAKPAAGRSGREPMSST